MTAYFSPGIQSASNYLLNRVDHHHQPGIYLLRRGMFLHVREGYIFLTAISCGRTSGRPKDFAAAAFLASSGSWNTTLKDQSLSHSTYLGPKPWKYACHHRQHAHRHVIQPHEQAQVNEQRDAQAHRYVQANAKEQVQAQAQARAQARMRRRRRRRRHETETVGVRGWRSAGGNSGKKWKRNNNIEDQEE